jgi:hypothetical protein
MLSPPWPERVASGQVSSYLGVMPTRDKGNLGRTSRSIAPKERIFFLKDVKGCTERKKLFLEK